MSKNCKVKELERCLMCTELEESKQMKFFQRTGHWVCNSCFISVTDGFSYKRVLELIDK